MKRTYLNNFTIYLSIFCENFAERVDFYLIVPRDVSNFFNVRLNCANHGSVMLVKMFKTNLNKSSIYFVLYKWSIPVGKPFLHQAQCALYSAYVRNRGKLPQLPETVLQRLHVAAKHVLLARSMSSNYEL